MSQLVCWQSHSHAKTHVIGSEYYLLARVPYANLISGWQSLGTNGIYQVYPRPWPVHPNIQRRVVWRYITFEKLNKILNEFIVLFVKRIIKLGIYS